VGEDAAQLVGGAERGRVVLREAQREERVVDQLEQRLVERVGVLAQLPVARADGEGEGEALQPVRVAREGVEPHEERPDRVRRAATRLALVLDRVGHKLAQAARAKLAQPRVLRVARRGDARVEHRHRVRRGGALRVDDPVDDLQRERLEETAHKAVGVGGQPQ